MHWLNIYMDSLGKHVIILCKQRDGAWAKMRVWLVGKEDISFTFFLIKKMIFKLIEGDRLNYVWKTG